MIKALMNDVRKLVANLFWERIVLLDVKSDHHGMDFWFWPESFGRDAGDFFHIGKCLCEYAYRTVCFVSGASQQSVGNLCLDGKAHRRHNNVTHKKIDY